MIRILVENHMHLSLPELIQGALPAFGELIQDPTEPLLGFFADRLAVNLRDQGYSAQEVDAVLALNPARLGDVPKRLDAVRDFAALPESAWRWPPPTSAWATSSRRSRASCRPR